MSEEEELRREEYQYLKDKLINAKNKIDYSLKNYNTIVNQIKQDLIALKKIKDLDFETFNKEFDAWFNNLRNISNAINDKLVSISVGIEAYDSFHSWEQLGSPSKILSVYFPYVLNPKYGGEVITTSTLSLGICFNSS